MTREREQHFWSRGEGTAAGCLEWQGSRQVQGYGMFRIGRGVVSAHRLAAQIMGWDIRGKDVLHRCDNPPCFSPAHLFAGTHSDNMLDAVAKGRTPRGERKPRARLTDDIVRAIRAGGRSDCEWARVLSVGHTTVRKARIGSTWKHVA